MEGGPKVTKSHCLVLAGFHINHLDFSFLLSTYYVPGTLNTLQVLSCLIFIVSQ